MIKKDLNFLKKYENKEGQITFDTNNVIISCEGLLESHKIPTASVSSFDLMEFYSVFKTIHGSRHRFEVENNTIQISIKKDGTVESTQTLKKVASIQREGHFEDIGTIDAFSFEKIGLYKNISVNLDYLSFLKNPLLVCDNNELYLWGTDAIHQLRINAKLIKKSHSFEIPVEFCAFLKGFVSADMTILKIATNKKALKIYDENHELSFHVSTVKNTDIYLNNLKSATSMKLDSQILKELEELKLKKLCSDVNKDCSKTYEVIYTLKNGIFYLQDKEIFHFHEDMTCIKPISAYRFNEFIQDATEIYISKSYIKNKNAYLIL